MSDVSIMTVSRVVNETGEISPTARRPVVAVTERLDYRPSGIARGLASQLTGTILAFVVRVISNPLFSGIPGTVEDGAYGQGHNVFLCKPKDDTPLAALATPPLTTGRGPRYDLGMEASEMLPQRIQEATEQFHKVPLLLELVVRASASELPACRKEETSKTNEQEF
jgi:DNA-binding LacI/PurR family transcriptional regulator